MIETERFWAIKSVLIEYVKSPSLKHIRDTHSLAKLARDILLAVDRASYVWRKWDGPREDIVKAAARCWIPAEDLRAFLNDLPGPDLTVTDVNQRLRAIWNEPYGDGDPDEDVKEGCLTLYEKERAARTELMAIIGVLVDYICEEQGRLRKARAEAYERRQAEERARQEEMFRLGADMPWIKIGASKDLFCRKNGRAFRIAQDKDKRWSLFRISGVDGPGTLLGVYGTRGDITKALKQIAYVPEPRW